MTEAEDFIYQYDGAQRELMLFLHQLLTDDFNLIAKLRYKIPFYYRKSWICYLNPTKKGTVEFTFVRGNELSNEQGWLDHKGRKQVYSVELGKISDIPQQTLYEVLQEAVLLDETVPYASKRNIQ